MNKVFLAVLVFGFAIGSATQSNENTVNYKKELILNSEACEEQCAEMWVFGWCKFEASSGRKVWKGVFSDRITFIDY